MASKKGVELASHPTGHESVKNLEPNGLTSDEAKIRLEKDGPNAMPDTSAHPLRNALIKFWAPVPWLLEAAILLQVGLHKYLEAAVIAGLLVFNAALAWFQEGRAQATLTALKSRLALNASVRRDGVWRTVPAAELVRGDLVKLSLGGVVAADVHLLDGSVLLDQSMLTGESLPIEAGAGVDTYAGSLVRRGEATAVVTATGMRTKFGRTAELVRTAHVVSSQQKAVLRIVRNLAIFNGGIIVLIGTYAWFHAMPWNEIIPLLLTSVLASIPVALPATFTLAAALGARALAKVGVLPTRLTALDEAATINVLCSDKTGTLTRNQLFVTSVRPMPGFDEAHILGLAALASSDGGQDSVDAAIRSAAAQKPAADLPKLTSFVPFDPGTKISEAMATDAKGRLERIVKGAFTVVAGMAAPAPAAAAIADDLEKQGFRVLAVAAGAPAAMRDARLHRAERSAAHRLRFPHLGIEGTRRAYRHGDGRCAGDRGHCCPRGRTGRRCVSRRDRFPRPSSRRISRSSQAFFRKENSTSSKHFRRMGTRSGCAETARTMRRRCARHRSELLYRRPPT